jgi:hypothetical protein
MARWPDWWFLPPVTVWARDIAQACHREDRPEAHGQSVLDVELGIDVPATAGDLPADVIEVILRLTDLSWTAEGIAGLLEDSTAGITVDTVEYVLRCRRRGGEAA